MDAKNLELWKMLEERVRETGTVSEACRALGISRSSYYRHRAARRGPRPPASVSKSDEHRERILGLALEHPHWGCVRISFYLELHGIRISSPTVQKILKSGNLGKAEQRLAARKRTPH